MRLIEKLHRAECSRSKEVRVLIVTRDAVRMFATRGISVYRFCIVSLIQLNDETYLKLYTSQYLIKRRRKHERLQPSASLYVYRDDNQYFLFGRNSAVKDI